MGMSVCVCVCVWEDISGTTHARFTKYFVHGAYGHGSVHQSLIYVMYVQFCGLNHAFFL